MRGELEFLVRCRERGEPQIGRGAFESLRKVASRAGPGDGGADDNLPKFSVKRANSESERALLQTHR